jgi:hypothetical protein
MSDQNISVVVCDDCQRALFVNGHPRNFCGHSGRGTLTEFVPKALVDRLMDGGFLTGPGRKIVEEALKGE